MKALKKESLKKISALKIVFSIVLFSMILGFFYKTNSFFFNQSNELKEYFVDKDCFLENKIYAIDINTKEIQQLKEQFDIISKIKKPYLVTAKKYSSFNYTFSIFLTFFSILVGVMGFIITKKGWDNITNYYLKSTFLIAFFFATLFGLLPKVLGNEENIKNNLSKYNFYNGLQLDIYSLVNDNKGYLKRNTESSKDSLNLEILSITKNIKENQDLYFNIFIDKVPKEIRPFD